MFEYYFGYIIYHYNFNQVILVQSAKLIFCKSVEHFLPPH